MLFQPLVNSSSSQNRTKWYEYTTRLRRIIRQDTWREWPRAFQYLHSGSSVSANNYAIHRDRWTGSATHVLLLTVRDSISASIERTLAALWHRSSRTDWCNLILHTSEAGRTSLHLICTMSFDYWRQSPTKLSNWRKLQLQNTIPSCQLRCYRQLANRLSSRPRDSFFFLISK